MDGPETLALKWQDGYGNSLEKNKKETGGHGGCI